MNHPVLAVQHLHFSYDKDKDVLCDVSFCVAGGESVALVGANGAGKSTLLLHTNGTYLGTKGKVCIQGVTVSPATLTEVRKSVGMVFQDPDDQLFFPSVEQDIAFGPRNMGLSPFEIEERIEKALVLAGAMGLRKCFSHKLSGGEKRRVALATVLAMDPSLLVFDEPSAYLDPRSRTRLIETLKGLPQAKIVATHDLDLAWDVCERTIVLSRGRVVFDGKTKDAFSDDKALAQWELEKPLRLQGCPRCV